MKRLMCRFFGHKWFSVCLGKRCGRCGIARLYAIAYTREALDLLKHNLTFTAGAINGKG